VILNVNLFVNAGVRPRGQSCVFVNDDVPLGSSSAMASALGCRWLSAACVVSCGCVTSGDGSEQAMHNASHGASIRSSSHETLRFSCGSRAAPSNWGARRVMRSLCPPAVVKESEGAVDVRARSARRLSTNWPNTTWPTTIAAQLHRGPRCLQLYPACMTHLLRGRR